MRWTSFAPTKLAAAHEMPSIQGARKMKITQRQIAIIAAETKSVCHREGIGNVVNVFADGSMLEGVSENDVIARGSGNGGWDYRIACLRYPMTRAQVAEYLAQCES
jgi:hypothetical protein